MLISDPLFPPSWHKSSRRLGERELNGPHLIGMNIRVHPAEAKRANFTSIELADNSGDVYGMPTVFHNLHCLVSILLSPSPRHGP